MSLTWGELLRLKGGVLWDTRPQELLDRLAGTPVPFVCAYGGGVNSTAGLVLLWKLGIRPDAILFADVGDNQNGKPAEKPETYEHVKIMSAWCVANDFPEIVTVWRKVDPERQLHNDKYHTLEEECEVKKCLPSIAYFHRSCSQKWKHSPQEIWLNNWLPSQEWRAKGGKVLKAIFYDADEPNRAKVDSSSGCQFWHPLLDYDWGRDECVAAIRMAGLPVPAKSSCFFCPEMTPREVFELRDQHPALLARALAMEANADLRSIKGLGKHDYSWRDLIDGKVPLDVIDKANGSKRLPCMCED